MTATKTKITIQPACILTLICETVWSACHLKQNFLKANERHCEKEQNSKNVKKCCVSLRTSALQFQKLKHDIETISSMKNDKGTKCKNVQMYLDYGKKKINK